MDNFVTNCNGKIWLFWNVDIYCNFRDEYDQKISCDFNYNELQNQFTITFMYAKCKEHLRRPLWDKMLQHAEREDKPWCLVGDYNVITSTEEKFGGYLTTLQTAWTS